MLDTKTPIVIQVSDKYKLSLIGWKKNEYTENINETCNLYAVQ